VGYSNPPPIVPTGLRRRFRRAGPVDYDAAVVRGVWPLTGRVEELEVVDAALRRPDAPRGVVLAGAAGVGKTRLAREVVALASRRGARVRWAVGTESGRALPLAAFSGLLGAVDADPAHLVPAAADALLGGTDGARLVVGVDDAHLLDDVSALVLHHLVLHTRATVVVTVRTGRPAPDVVNRLWKDALLPRLELQPLSEPETADVLTRVLGGQLDSRAAHRLWALTGGNPLYLTLLVDGELAAGRLQPTQGVWRWVGDVEVAPGLAEQVTANIGLVPGPVAAVLDVLAVAEPSSVTELSALVGPAAVEDAEQRGLVTVQPDGRRLHVRLAHPLYGEVRRESIGRLRSRRLRTALAQALLATGTRRADDPMRLAVLALDTDLELDADILLAGARRAARSFDFLLAKRLGEAAAAAGAGAPAQLLVASMNAAVAFATTDEPAAPSDAAAVQAASASEIGAQVVQAAWIANQPEAAEALALAAEQRFTGGDRLAVTAVRAYLVACLGRPRPALELAAEVLGADGPPAAEVSPEAVAWASCARTLALAATGRADELPDAARVGCAAALRSRDAFLRVPLAALEVIGMRLAGRPERGLAVARQCLAEVSGMFPAEIFAGCVVGEAELAAGLLPGALRHLTEAKVALTGTGGGGFEHSCRIQLTQALAVAGRAAEAREVLAELLASDEPTMRFLGPDRLLAEAWVAAADGITSSAVEHARAAAARAAEGGQSAYEVLALHVAARFGDGSVAGRLHELAREVTGPRAAAAAGYADAVTADAAGALAAASDTFERMGDLLAAADAAAQAGSAFARHGQRAEAIAASRRAGRLAEQCGGARTPALLAALRPLPITAREREILSMAAAGMTNQQIANRLVVSVRTVEGHLYRASGKIGTADRTRFAAILHGD
jgi:DNA-binding CsgD family transcriptional regulator